MPLAPCLLLLLLPGGTTTATLPLWASLPGTDEGHLQEVTEIQNDLGPFLAWWNEWRTSRAAAEPLSGRAARGVGRWQDGAAPPQATRREKPPCKNFFWKTFASCK
ncbi:cortistatin [Tenrec ecaudatus]|uniref:cortistatin n=1 Tax=Tenrec ecaudatus TaxID=94439 RepID=UPI003F5A03E2